MITCRRGPRARSSRSSAWTSCATASRTIRAGRWLTPHHRGEDPFQDEEMERARLMASEASGVKTEERGPKEAPSWRRDGSLYTAAIWALGAAFWAQLFWIAMFAEASFEVPRPWAFLGYLLPLGVLTAGAPEPLAAAAADAVRREHAPRFGDARRAGANAAHGGLKLAARRRGVSRSTWPWRAPAAARITPSRRRPSRLRARRSRAHASPRRAPRRSSA